MPDFNHPHDHLFKAVFSKRQVMLDYIQQLLPKEIWQDLDLRTLKLSPTSGVNEKLKEHFSDLIYTCTWKGKEKIRISLLLEHKSYPVKYPHLQLLRYMLNIWEEDADQKKSLRPIIPILFYHGEQKWPTQSFEETFGSAGSTFKRFIPSFDYHLTDLSDYPDELILSLKKGFLVNSLLVMKHKSDEVYLIRHSDRIFIYKEWYLEIPDGQQFIKQLLTYIIQSNRMDVQTFEKFMETLDNQIRPLAGSTYEQILQKGMQQGIEQGIERGIEQVILNLMKKFPELKNKELSEMADVPLELVEQVRQKNT